ncbi:MAG: FtsQ-type POTRA domain-containing protein [Gemmatimonadetes bacterium]|nr:FtsQ-type POTRA domain-containing protein [Gemmatimonadota bacterium]
MIGVRFFVSLCCVAAGALLASEVRPRLARLDLFRVQQIRVEGARYVHPATVLAQAGVPMRPNLWADPEPWVEALRAHPMIRDARVRRRLPSTLVLEIEERRPVALLATPVLRAVDADGMILPVDPGERALDLPVIRPTAGRRPAVGRRTSAEVRTLVTELERLKEMAPAFLSTVSDLALGPGKDVSVRLTDPPVELRYRPPLDPRWLRDALLVLRDAGNRRADSVPAIIDLRFADQVVVRYGPLPVQVAANGR